MKFDKVAMIRATDRSKAHVENALDLADLLRNDPNKKQRLAAQNCVWCYYSKRVALAAITSSKCLLCGIDMSFGNSDTDALCFACAYDHSLCKRCGGDRELRVGRRNWPEGKVNE